MGRGGGRRWSREDVVEGAAEGEGRGDEGDQGCEREGG